ncbi:hypothetical protein [Treponema sp.]|uniref:hypothetical protein n=1 Tax=Treponema sp. TaxID=166 RepID=UPI00388DB8B0
MSKNENKKVKQRQFPLGVKLAVIIGFIVLASLGTVTFLNSWFVSKDVRITAEENNLTINTRSSSSVQNELLSVRSNVLQLLDLINAASGGRTSALAKQAEAFFFERNQSIAEVIVLTQYQFTHNLVIHTRLKNNRFFTSNEIDLEATDSLLSQSEKSLVRACSGETIALNASPFFKNEMIALLLPYRESGLEQCCLILFSLESISSILGTGSSNETFMINDSSELLCHPENERILSGQSMKNHPLVKEMREKKPE